VRRGCDDFEIEEGESGKPDHLLFLVHGIGSVCDLKFRTVVEVGKNFLIHCVYLFITLMATIKNLHFQLMTSGA